MSGEQLLVEELVFELRGWIDLFPGILQEGYCFRQMRSLHPYGCIAEFRLPVPEHQRFYAPHYFKELKILYDPDDLGVSAAVQDDVLADGLLCGGVFEAGSHFLVDQDIMVVAVGGDGRQVPAGNEL